MEKYGLTPAQYPDFAALRGDPQRQPARHPRRRREDRRQVDPRVRLARRRWSTGSTRSRARSARSSATTSTRCMHNRRLTELVRDVPLEVDARRPDVGACDRDEIHKLFDTLQFRGDCATGCSRRSAPAEARGRRGLRGRGRHPRARTRWPAWLAAHARRAGRAWPSRARTAAAPAGSTASRSPLRRGARRPARRPFIDPTTLTEADEGALRAWLADASQAKGGARRQGPDAGAVGARLDAARRSPATPRWRPTWRCRGSARSPLDDLVRALSRPRAARRGGAGGPGQPRSTTTRRRRGAATWR